MDGAVFGAAFPLAVKSAQMLGRQVFPVSKNKVQNIWQQNAGRQLNVEQAAANQKNRYNDFLAANAEKEVFDAAPTRKQLSMYSAQSKFNLPRENLIQEQAQKLLRSRAIQQGIDIGGNIKHYTKDTNRMNYIRTLANTLEKPDIVFSNGGNWYVVKKYDAKGKSFFDFIIQKDGKLYNKFKVNARYLDGRLNEAAENVSFSGRVLEPTGAGYIRPVQKPDKNLSLNEVVVNPTLPNISTIERGFTDFQKKAFYDAMAQAVERSSGKVGSLETTQIMQDAIDDMLKKSYKLSEAGKKRPTAESLPLYELKAKLNELMKPTGTDKYQAGLAKADALQSAYHRGYGSASSGGTAGGLSFSSLRDRRAFLQGRFANHLYKAKDGHDLAARIVADKETFRSLLRPQHYEHLMREITKINAESGDGLYGLVPYLVQLLGE